MAETLFCTWILVGLSPYPIHPSSAADPLPFSPQGTGDLSKLCAKQPTARCGVTRGWGHQEALGQRWQGAGWQAELLLYPSFVDTVFPEASWEKKEKTPT